MLSTMAYRQGCDSSFSNGTKFLNKEKKSTLKGAFKNNPVYRGIYGATLDVFPSAFLLFSAAMTMTTGFISFYLYTRRGNVERYQKSLAEKQVLEESEKEGKVT